MTEAEGAKLYNEFQRAQKAEGYLLIGIKHVRKNGKYRIICIPPRFIKSK